MLRILKTPRAAITLAVMLTALTAFTAGATTTGAQSNRPSPPTNVEMIHTGGNDNGNDAVLQWNYDDQDDGYLMERRDGTSGPWDCVVAGGYPDGDTIEITTTKGGPMAASENWYFRVYSINEQDYSYIDEATCNEDADYGYVYSTKSDEGFTLSTPAVIGPKAVGIDQSDDPPPVSELDTPTGFTITSAKHGRVKLEWDSPTDDGATTNYIIKRQWLGEHQDQNGNTRANPDLCIFFPSSTYQTYFNDPYVSAYDDTGEQEQYRYRLYATNDNYEIRGCDDTTPSSTPAELVATLELSTRIQILDGKYIYQNPPAPTGLNLTTRYNRRHSAVRIKVSWDYNYYAPAFQIRYRKTGEEWADPIINQSTNFPQMWLADGTIFESPPNGKNLGKDLIENDTVYEIQVGTCNTVDCDSVAHASSQTIRSAKRDQ